VEIKPKTSKALNAIIQRFFIGINEVLDQ